MEALIEELEALVEESRVERARGEGDDRRLARRLHAALERARRRGILYGNTSEQAFAVRIVAPGEVEVLIRKPPRSPRGLTLRFRRP